MAFVRVFAFDSAAFSVCWTDTFREYKDPMRIRTLISMVNRGLSIPVTQSLTILQNLGGEELRKFLQE